MFLKRIWKILKAFLIAFKDLRKSVSDTFQKPLKAVEGLLEYFEDLNYGGQSLKAFQRFTNAIQGPFIAF